MRGSRLLSILMRVQTRGGVTAQELARELEVSVRTIYRDVDELSASGVPIYAERGRTGGFRLLEGYRTRLTGLTPAEAEAVFLSGLKGPAAALGIGEALAGAELKLQAALPESLRQEAARMSERFHLDPIAWFRRADEHEALPVLAQATREQRAVRVRYRSSKGVSERDLLPIGIVLKAGVWYLIAKSSREPLAYRVSNLEGVALTDETFERPAKFDLAAYWREWSEGYEASLYRAEAVLKLTERGLRLASNLSAAVADALDKAAAKPDRAGWLRVTIPIENIDQAARDLLALGENCEVVSPTALRARIAKMADDVARIYASA
jgi:predicted DNA-binding transcriptional regulator YafY